MKSTIALSLLLACVGHAGAATQDPELFIRSGGGQRSYYLHIPAQLPAQTAAPAALVVAMHGGGGNGPIQASHTGLSAVADAHGFIVAYPNGSGMLSEYLLTWNAGTCCAYSVTQGIDDVAFIRAMVADIEQHHAIDRKRIYATGMSNGGMMSYRLACDASDLFAAVGVVSGTQTVSPCKASEPVSVIHFHGTADQYVPIDGGVGSNSRDRSYKPAVHSGIDFWARRDGCPAERIQQPLTQTSGHVARYDYGPCQSGTDVVLYLIAGSGHAWPGGTKVRMVADEPSQEINASAVLWDFFAAHPKP